MTTSTAARGAWPAERRFYTTMSLAILAAVCLGFARTFFLRPWFPEAASMAAPEPFFLFHGAVFTAWFVVLALQPAFLGARRIDLHRAWGKLGVAIAMAVVVTGVTGTIIAARRPGGFIGIPLPPAQFAAVPLVDMLLFAFFVALAVARRRDPQSHKRLMLVGSISLLVAAVARWPGVIGADGPAPMFVITDLFLLPLVAWDLRSRGSLHPVTIWGGLLLVASQPLRLWMSGTEAWLGLMSRIL
jgi:FtsH-binding integral membrane protein